MMLRLILPNNSGAALADHWPIIGTFTYTVEQEEGEHVHSYVMTEESPATCTEEGYTIYTCACGESYEEPLAALGHDYQISSRTEATCTEPGEIVYTCGRCGDSYLEMISGSRAQLSGRSVHKLWCTGAFGRI